MARTHAVLLYSGGLDSILAAKILMDQGIEVTGYQCLLPFLPPDLDPETLETTEIAREAGLKLVFHRLDREYLEIIKSPPHGYGRHMNPCIDCKIHFIKKAAQYMRQIRADFVATGEVVGQRPMSQMKHTLKHIEKVCGIEGRLLRPLSAQILDPTIPEKEGLVDREKLMGINGRSRKDQLSLAREMGITRFSSPGGGCLFTDSHIAARVRDLLDHHASVETLDIYLLTLGRHFRLTERAKIIVGRNEKENNKLEKYRKDLDYILVPGFRGPNIAVTGDVDADVLGTACSVCSRYGKPGDPERDIALYRGNEFQGNIEAPEPIDENKLNSMRI